jgi:ABC-type nitrate/sulfonate/bicarbonate transport system substrate-binding protein
MTGKELEMTVKNNASPHRKHLLITLAVTVAVLAISACFFSCSRTDQKPAGPLEKVTIAYSATTDAVLAEVAQVKGYFLQEGLEVNPHLHPMGNLHGTCWKEGRL